MENCAWLNKFEVFCSLKRIYNECHKCDWLLANLVCDNYGFVACLPTTIKLDYVSLKASLISFYGAQFLSQPFYSSQYPITLGQLRRFRDDY